MRDGFDLAGFHAALDAQRTAKNLTWKDVAAQSGVSASTLTRMSQGRRPGVNSLALLLAWSGLEASSFLSSGADEPELLARIAVMLRADRNLSQKSAEALQEIITVAYERFRER